jgi:glycosyltransferase involved in cell wall biosynthesis
VVIPAFNSEKTIAACLQSFGRQTHPPHEVIVVDGKSEDATAQIVKEFDTVQLLINETSHTPGSSRNRGAEAAQGDILFFCDADCTADDRALEAHVNAYARRSDIVGVMGAIQNANPGNPIAEFVQREIMANQWLQNLNPDGTVNQVHTGIFSMQRAEFLKWKFIEDSQVSEDSEFSLRIRNRLKILFEPRAIVFHPHPTTLSALFKQRKGYGERFIGLTKYYHNGVFKPDSLFSSAMRYRHFSSEDLVKAIFQDNRLLCRGCPVQKCKFETMNLPKQGNSNEFLYRLICLAFASGILKKRTGIEYQWQ